MQRTNLWNDCASRVTSTSGRARHTSGFERIEQLLVPYAAVTDSWLQRLLSSFSAPASVAARCERARFGGR